MNTWYAGGAVYDDNNPTRTLKLRELPVNAGDRVATYYVQEGEYVYDLKDHLGSTRVRFRKDPDGTGVEVEAYYNFYPFGLDHSENEKTDNLSDRHRYQGSYAEKDEETGYYSFLLRQYSPIIGRWLMPDPKHQYPSPYVGMGNEPAKGVDPTGGEKYDDININSKTNEYTVTLKEGPHNIIVDGKTISSFEGGYELRQRFNEYGNAYDVEINRQSYKNYMLDPNSVGNIFENYGGWDNPKSFNGLDNFTAEIKSVSDGISFFHDKAYDRIGIKGVKGVLFNTEAIPYDARFVSDQYSVAGYYLKSKFSSKPYIDPITNRPISLRTAVSALGAGTAIFLGTFPKSVISDFSMLQQMLD